MYTFYCEAMTNHLAKGEVALSYDDVSRSYGVSILDERSANQSTYYCQWFETKLTSDLINEFFDTGK